jgi:predicted permease
VEGTGRVQKPPGGHSRRGWEARTASPALERVAVSHLPRHLRTALRKLARAPLFTLTALVTLALGIGANTAIFSVVNGVLLKPLPFDEPDRLLGMWHEAPGLDFPLLNQSPATYLTYRADSGHLEDIALWAGRGPTVQGPDRPEEVEALMVTDGFLGVLRVRPALGRDFAAADDGPGAAPTVILGHSYWLRAFGGDPGVVGRTLTVSGTSREVIGVLPEDFRFLDRNPAILYPAGFDPAQVIMGNFSYQGIARLRPGSTVEEVSAEVARLARVAVDRYPGPLTMSMMDQARFGPRIRPLSEDLVGDVRPMLWVLLGTVGIVLLIACANVANLFLVRAEGRVREIAVRTALGAGRRDVAAAFLSESLLLGVAGGLLGVGLAWGGLRLLVGIAPGRLPRLEEIGLDPAVLLFTLVISLLAGFAFGLFPLFRYGRPDLAPALKEGGRGGMPGRERHRLRNGLVVGQVALALVLLVGSGLMVRTFQALRNVSPGVEDPSALLTFRTVVPTAQVADPYEAAETLQQILHDLRETPGVSSAGAASYLPFSGNDSNDPLFIESRPVEPGQIPPIRRFMWTMPGYFEAMGMPLLAGRDIAWDDLRVPNAVTVLSASLAREVWGDPARAIGERVATLGLEGQGLVWAEVVGIVGDVPSDGLDQPVVPTVYWPAVQADLYGRGPEIQRGMSYVVRAAPGAMDGLLPRVQQVVWGVAPSLPVASVGNLGEMVDRSLSRTSFTLVMLGIAAGVALLLGSIGLYGVVSYTVSQRSREIGVRMAMGASRGSVSRMIVREGLALAGAGVALGVVGALLLSRLMGSLLHGVGALDPMTYLGVSAVLVAVAAAASWVPARRAAGVDPAVTLRGE